MKKRKQFIIGITVAVIGIIIGLAFLLLGNNDKGKNNGMVLFSSPYSDTINGFNGPIPLQITFDNNGRITEVLVLDNNETPRFLQRVIDAGFLDSWNGLTAEEALNKEVDAVSGATYSSNGIKNSLKARLEAIHNQ